MLINLLLSLTLNIFSSHRTVDARRLPDIYWNSTNEISTPILFFMIFIAEKVLKSFLLAPPLIVRYLLVRRNRTIGLKKNSMNGSTIPVNLIRSYCQQAFDLLLIGFTYESSSTYSTFAISNTDHVMTVKLLDRVTIICPEPSANPQISYEYTKLYAVSQTGYENCQLLDERLIGVCQSPRQQSSISIVFRDFSPLPGALEFKPGHSYYFITTSDGTENGIDRRSGGLCASDHMKIKFEIQPDRSDNLNDYFEPSSAHFRHRLENSAEVSTPLLYIIHTSDSSAEGYVTSEDDSDSACNYPLNKLLTAAALIFLHFIVII